MNSLRIVVVSAGLSQAASTRLLADRLATATTQSLNAAHRAVDIVPVELRELATDIAHSFVTGFPGARLREVIREVTTADAIIAVTPIFSASYSGLFKSFFDVIDDDSLIGKPVLIAATGGTARHSLALEYAMRPLFSYLRAVVVPTAVFAATADWGANAEGGADGLSARVTRAAHELASLLGQSPGPSEAEEPVTPFEEQLAALHSMPKANE